MKYSPLRLQFEISWIFFYFIQSMTFESNWLKVGANSVWSFGPYSTLGSIGTTAIAKTHPSLFLIRKTFDYVTPKKMQTYTKIWLSSRCTCLNSWVCTYSLPISFCWTWLTSELATRNPPIIQTVSDKAFRTWLIGLLRWSSNAGIFMFSYQFGT